MQEGAQGESHVASTDDELAKVPAVRKRVGLVRLAELLKGLDAMLGLKRRSPGVYQFRSRAFLHFHYDPSGEIVADVKAEGPGLLDIGGGWQRVDATQRAGQKSCCGPSTDSSGFEKGAGRLRWRHHLTRRGAALPACAAARAERRAR